MFKYINLSFVFVVCCLLACNTTNNKELEIRFSADSSKIIITHIEPVGLYQIKTNLSDTSYQDLVNVLQTPAEDDSVGMEMDWPGKLRMQGDTLVYTPISPFVKGNDYLVETFIDAQFGNAKDIATGKIGRHIKPKTLLLHR